MRKTYTYISMLRGINVSGQKKLPLTELNNTDESWNLDNVVTTRRAEM